MKKIHAVKFNRNPVLDEQLPIWRSRFVLIGLTLGFLTLFGRSFYLQIFEGDFLQARGEERFSRTLITHASRGNILDRDGKILATSAPVFDIWGIPEKMALTKEEMGKLSDLLDISVKDVEKKMKMSSNFVYLKREVSPELAAKIKEFGFAGVYQERDYKRYYPNGEMMAHVVGFTNVDERGQEGIELAFEKHLRGINGERRVLKNRRGQVFEEVEEIREPTNGKDVVLSIDSRMQYVVWSALSEGVSKNKAKAASAVVLNRKTGEIMALVNFPTYNPNARSDLSGEQIRNRAITDTFEPGSTMKPFIIAAALESGKVKPETVFNTSTGKVAVGKEVISDAHPHPDLNVFQILQKSSNVGTVKMAMQFKPEEMWGLYSELGFGKQVNIGFPGEVSGRLRGYKSWKPIEQATMSFGHGLSVNLLQMAQAYLAFANFGRMVPVTLMKVDEESVSATKRIYSAKTAKEINKMLEAVVSKEGTAPDARVEGCSVGGKTGTAHKIEGGRYVNKYVASFVGFAPIENPEIIVAVMVDEPSAGKHYGGSVAGPIFAKIIKESLVYLGSCKDN